MTAERTVQSRGEGHDASAVQPLPGMDGDGNRTARGALGKEAYIWLRNAIISGELQPDDPLSEVALAQRLNISRTPVREALTRLANDGLVRNLPGRGSRVAGISLTDITDLFQLREVLEGLLARLAAQNVRSQLDRVEELEQLIDQFTAYEDTGGRPSFKEYYQLTATMDSTLIAMAGNRRLEEALRDVWAHSRRLRQYASHDVERLEASATEHVEILDAVKAGDVERADAAVRLHMQNSRRALLTKVIGEQR